MLWKRDPYTAVLSHVVCDIYVGKDPSYIKGSYMKGLEGVIYEGGERPFIYEGVIYERS